MDIRNFIKKKFGKNVFSLSPEDLLKERLKSEKNVERLSADIKTIQEKIQRLMIEAKGQTRTLKMLNVQKIKSLRLEAATKQQEANHYLRELQVILLIEAMHEHEKFQKESDFVERIMNTDIEQLSSAMVDIDVKKAVEEGRLDLVKGKLSNIFGKEELPVDDESQDIMKAIEDLEAVDEETAMKMAGEKAKTLAESTEKKKETESE
ncbi:MAG: hypothetical protein JSV63_03830 [Candidatus Aenigmatarchaeota archaeon]|nr:MAG: hypothetical protein JSV63_03830 [Candidatus Aenigmarchaeota archaeon]